MAGKVTHPGADIKRRTAAPAGRSRERDNDKVGFYRGYEGELYTEWFANGGAREDDRRDLLVGLVARHGEYERDVYLPAGSWGNYHSNEWFTSDAGAVVRDVPMYRDGLFRLPVFARAGAILPKMRIDGGTKDAFGHRRDGGAAPDELIVRGSTPARSRRASRYKSSFTL